MNGGKLEGATNDDPIVVDNKLLEEGNKNEDKDRLSVDIPSDSYAVIQSRGDNTLPTSTGAGATTPMIF